LSESRTVRIIALLVVCALSFSVVACKQEKKLTVWYGIADTGGYMLAFLENPANLVVARIPLNVLISYRKQLAEQGLESDDLGAIQSLFGIAGDHYLRANAILRQEASEYLDLLAMEYASFETEARVEIHRLKALIEAAPVLSKNALPDTLVKLAGPRTTSDDITDALKLLAKYKPLVMFYDMGLFLDPSLSSEELKRWTIDWTAHALRAAAK
jgi:hypothetical protein